MAPRGVASAAIAVALFAVSAFAAPSYPVTFTTSPPTTPPQKVSLFGGINVGHNWDISWQMFMKRLGANGARLFGGTGGVAPDRTLATFGQDLQGMPVTNAGQYTAAVAQLRTLDGHAPDKASKWAVPLRFSIYDGGLSADDRTKPAGQSVLAQVVALQNMGIEPLVVQWATCGSFALTTFDKSSPMFYQERWELYKHQYTIAMWAWNKGVRKLEFWNEPDLNAPCINFNATQWVDYHVVQTSAINDAFADLNQEFKTGQRACNQGFLSCPIQPIVHASAFASAGFSGDASPPAGAVYLGGPSVSNEHTEFPSYRQNNNIQNMHAYSLHTYGKTGQQYQSTLSNLDQSIAAVHTDTTGKYPTLPVVVTEHMTHTSGQWGQSIPSTADAAFEASRLAAQMMRSLSNGYESYVFKFSTTPSQNGGIAKTGIHWGDVSQFPFIVGDVTRTGEAARLVFKSCSGDKIVDQIAVAKSTSSQTVPANAFRTATSTKDNARRYFIFINDCAATSGFAADCDTNANPGNAADVTLTVNLNSWGLPAGTIIPVTQVSATAFGDVVALTTLSAAGTITVPAPSASVTLLTAQATGAQTVTALPAVDDACIGPAQPSANYNSGQLTVSTSASADHTNTRVSLLKFQVPKGADSGGLTAAILELTLSQAPAQDMLLSIFGTACDTQWSEASVTWTSAGAFAVNSSIPVNAPITRLSQNFQYIDATTTFAGHLTIPAGAAVGTTFRVDVADYVSQCPGQAVTLSIHRRLRNPLFTGNVAGNIPADDLSGGASVSFYSAESTSVQVPQLRLLLATSIASGAMSAAFPGRSAGTPAGRRALGVGTDSQQAVSASLSAALGVPVNVSVTSYSISINMTIQGLSLNTYKSSLPIQNAIQGGLGVDAADPATENIYVKSSQAAGPNGVQLNILVDGYDSAPDNGYTSALRDHDAMVENAQNFFNSLALSLANALGVATSAIQISVNPDTTNVLASYQVLMNTSVGATGNFEATFSSAVQSGLVQQILAQTLGGDMRVVPADPVQAQRIAVGVALALATTSNADQVAELQQQCLLQQVQAKEWRAVGIAFVIATGVFLLLIICLALALAYHMGQNAGHRRRASQAYAGRVSVMEGDKEPAVSPAKSAAEEA